MESLEGGAAFGADCMEEPGDEGLGQEGFKGGGSRGSRGVDGFCYPVILILLSL